MNANEPAMTKISPMNAGMLVLVEIESWGAGVGICLVPLI